MSVTISIRVDEEIKQTIEDMGFNPGEYLKNILINQLKKEKSKRALDWLKKHKIKSRNKTAEELIRIDRDA
jgi:hypothetical protein